MTTTFNATIEFKSITPEQWDELSAFLKRRDQAAPLISYERQRGNDLEDEADKLRSHMATLCEALKAMADTLQITEQRDNLIALVGSTSKAIAAYDNSTHKAIPF